MNDVLKAQGRTTFQNEVISSLVSWLDNGDLNVLLENFGFIDPGRKIPEKFLSMLIKEHPGFEKCADIKLERGLGESFCLNIISSTRFCHIHFYKDSKIPTCKCYWEDYLVFEFVLENLLDSALILKRWICDNVMPSDLVKEFSFLDKEELSKYINFEKVIEAKFIQSWDKVEQNYRETSGLFKIDLSERLKFISQLRAKGYDKIFRAGTSVWELVLSRSKHHGLRNDQPYLIFEIRDDSEIKIYTSEKERIEGKAKLHSSGFDITPQIEKLLKEFEKENID